MVYVKKAFDENFITDVILIHNNTYDKTPNNMLDFLSFCTNMIGMKKFFMILLTYNLKIK